MANPLLRSLLTVPRLKLRTDWFTLGTNSAQEDVVCQFPTSADIFFFYLLKNHQVKAPETPAIVDAQGTTTGKAIDIFTVMGYKLLRK